MVNAPCICSSINAGTHTGDARYLLRITNVKGRLTVGSSL
jgi:hypothetical protein